MVKKYGAAVALSRHGRTAAFPSRPHPMFSLPILLSTGNGTTYKQQISRQIEALIRSGRLQDGDRLPAINRMATLLQVSKNTILGAYELLIDSNLVQSQPSRGYFVTLNRTFAVGQASPEFVLDCTPVYPDPVSPAQASGVYTVPPTAPIRFDFKVGRPSRHAFPLRHFTTLSNQLLQCAGSAMADYAPPAGLWGLRVQIADYLSAAKGLKVDPEQVLITAGSQEGMSLITSHFLDSGSEAVMESPCYAGFKNLVQRHHAKAVPIPVDTEGIRTDLLPERPVRLAYVTPSHQYPLGYTMSMARRRQLLEWAFRNGALVIEDDYDGDFCYESVLPPPLMAMNPQQVIYLGTFSKTLGPGLRLGYMVCPTALIDDFVQRKALLNNGNPWLTQAFMARYFDECSFTRHLQFLRRRYQEQRDELLRGLRTLWNGAGTVSGRNAGMHLAFHLPADSPDADAIAKAALRYGIRLYPLAHAASSECDVTDPRYLLFGYAGLDTVEIAEAMSLLQTACRQIS
ncbi:MocR-like pyridoxine biosynthesis transcription factor PdxR [Achromobacter marplatensis]|uniref:MocR-like pyridoxine biosynthesis transcription factor PdxR n=1 Tax=Achromobacter marplatensis TaxID=470868 RepID=UPI0039F66EB0